MKTENSTDLNESTTSTNSFKYENIINAGQAIDDKNIDKKKSLQEQKENIKTRLEKFQKIILPSIENSSSKSNSSKPEPQVSKFKKLLNERLSKMINELDAGQERNPLTSIKEVSVNKGFFSKILDQIKKIFGFKESEQTKEMKSMLTLAHDLYQIESNMYSTGVDMEEKFKQNESTLELCNKLQITFKEYGANIDRSYNDRPIEKEAEKTLDFSLSKKIEKQIKIHPNKQTKGTGLDINTFDDAPEKKKATISMDDYSNNEDLLQSIISSPKTISTRNSSMNKKISEEKTFIKKSEDRKVASKLNPSHSRE